MEDIEGSGLLAWWQRERVQIRAQLLEKAKSTPLSEVENMILKPYTVNQALTQVQMLNSLVNFKNSDGHSEKG